MLFLIVTNSIFFFINITFRENKIKITSSLDPGFCHIQKTIRFAYNELDFEHDISNEIRLASTLNDWYTVA